MEPIIDAHVHIMPARLQGTVDERFGVTMGGFGQKILPNGAAAPFLPNYMEASSFSVEALLHVMDESGVERAVIMQSLCFKINGDVAQAVARCPRRLRGAMVIEPRDGRCLDEIDEWTSKGLSVIKFEMSEPFGFTHPNAYPNLDFDSPLMNAVYDRAGKLGVTVTIDTSPIGSKGYQAEALHRAVKKHPVTRFVICHLAFPFAGIHGEPEKYARWKEMTSLARYDNVWFDLAAMPAIFREEDYPYPSAARVLREFLDAYGSGKAVWGSDIPGTYVDATYAQMRNMLTKSGLFAPEELRDMFYRSGKLVYFPET